MLFSQHNYFLTFCGNFIWELSPFVVLHAALKDTVKHFITAG